MGRCACNDVACCIFRSSSTIWTANQQNNCTSSSPTTRFAHESDLARHKYWSKHGEVDTYNVLAPSLQPRKLLSFEMAHRTVFPPDTQCFVQAHNHSHKVDCSHAKVSAAMVNFLNLSSSMDVYRQAYCLNPPHVCICSIVS